MDKTGNMYSMATNIYNDLIIKELNFNYKHAKRNALDEINEFHLEIVSELDLLERIQSYVPKIPHCLIS